MKRYLLALLVAALLTWLTNFAFASQIRPGDPGIGAGEPLANMFYR